MKAAVNRRYGNPDVVSVVEVPVPAPRKGEVLIRVKAVAVTAADARIRGANFPKGFGLMSRLFFGISRPRKSILGSAFSGTVEDSRSADFETGDEVCGMAGMRMGAHAEFVVVSSRVLARKPAEVSHDEAAGLLFGGSTALFFLRDKGAVASGMSVLVNGASGAIGTNAVQLAKHFGATVTAVTSGRNAKLVKSLGADHVVDYTSAELSGRYDVVLDTVGTISPATGRSLLTGSGVLLLAAANLWENLQARGNVKTGMAPERVQDFDFLLDLAARGELKVVLDQVSGLDGIVAAHAKVDSGRKVGNVIVRP